MTRLFDLPHAQVQEFLKGLAHAGLTGEQVLTLTRDRSRLGEWVSLLSGPDDIVAPSGSSKIEDLIVGEGRLVKALNRHGVIFVHELEGTSLEELMMMQHIGPASIEKIVATLAEKGLKLSTHSRISPDRVLDVYGVRALRRDKLDEVCLFNLINLPGLARGRLDDEMYFLTIGKFKEMSEERLLKAFTADQIRVIRRWIIPNVW